MISIAEIEQVFKDIFEEEEGMVKSIEVLYETPKAEGFLKLVISIHGLSIEDSSIIHTKFIFKVDENKRNLQDNTFIYLYNINCVYHLVEFESVHDLKKKVEDVIQSNDFGEDLLILSDFIEAPAMFLNYYMRRSDITDYSIFEVIYEPKFKTTPCAKMTFDFKININNNYDMELSIRKVEEEDKEVSYKFQYKFMDEIETIGSESIKNIHYLIGSNIASILDKKLKNK